MITETTTSAPATTMLCHNPNVSLNGITPLIFKIAGGNEAGVAMINAADEVSPKAHTPPTPR